MTSALFRILGPPQLEVDGALVSLGSRRTCRLLVTLLLRLNKPVSLDTLIAALWEVPPRSGRQQVHNAVSALRKVLVEHAPNAMLATADNGYRLSVADEFLDVKIFQETVERGIREEASGNDQAAMYLIESALEMWRGPIPEWLATPASRPSLLRLDEQRVATVERLAALGVRSGRTDSLIGELFERLRAHPFRESLRGSLMLALNRAGRQAEAIAVYEDARQLFARELGADPGPQLRRLHAQTLRGELSPAADEPVPESDTALRQKFFLPYDVQEFTGRAGELLQLTRRAVSESSSALVISAVDGMGGVGKTTLVVHLAHQLQKDYPDGQYFIDLRGFTIGREPVSPGEALYGLLQDSGVPAELIPHDVERRSAIWRSQMSGRRVLLVLDNASGEEQVRPLMPGTAGSLVLVTSRRKLPALDSAYSLSLDILPRVDAARLFEHIVGTERTAAAPDGVVAAVELCGRLPLAIRIAAARFRDRGSWTVDDLVAQLRTRSGRKRFLAARDRDVTAVINVSYRHMDATCRLLFRLLSVHPGVDFDAYAAASLAGVTVDAAEYALERLFEDNLLFQRKRGRYSFHDLVRDCAHRLSEEYDRPAIRDDATDRLLDHYLVAANRWNSGSARGPFKFDPVVRHPPAAIEDSDAGRDASALAAAEHENFIAALDLAEATGRFEILWQLTVSLQPALAATNYGSDAIKRFESARRAARHVGNRSAESATLSGLALAHRNRGSFALAQCLLNDAIKISRELGNASWEAEQLTSLGGAQLQDSHISEAHTSYSRAFDLVEGTEHPLYRALVNNLGVVCRELGDYQGALGHFHRALHLAEFDCSSPDRARCLVNIGSVHHFEGRHEEAVALLTAALAEYETVGPGQGEAIARMCLATSYRSLGRLGHALREGRAALDLARADNWREIECETLLVLGDIHLSLGNIHTAAGVVEQAEAAAERHGYRRYTARAHEGYAHISARRGDADAAQDHWHRAVELYPADLAEAAHARRHLAAVDSAGTTCARCAIVAPPQ